MPSVKNPNAPSKNRLAARAAKQRKTARQASKQGRLEKRGGLVTKADARRGARPGLLPTSGPRAAISKKKARKLERALGHAMKRKMEQEGVVGMAVDTPAEKKDEEKTDASAGAEMDIA
ncbi:hypothetical protein B0J18DRAFT_464711 [Chaetomium sp. MPI-SDFR-AT-0129]|nr:hypothetical protein B0J18DRAFT_464711 [Chaetomium sp. MPI-SDFR-AT-0129]